MTSVRKSIETALIDAATDPKFDLQFPSENIQVPNVVGTNTPTNFDFSTTKNTNLPTDVIIIMVLIFVFVGLIAIFGLTDFKIGKFMYDLHDKLNFKSVSSYFGKIVPTQTG